MEHKTLQELTIKDNFMFGAVMMDPENCREVLERILGIEIEHVEVCREKSIVYNPEYKGIRLDAYAKDDQNTRYNVEMQTIPQSELKKRARYYHSQIDMEILLCGEKYKELPNTYVIFICDFDPFGEKKFKYTQEKICVESPNLSMDDGAHTIFLSTKGKNEKEIPKELVQFLKFIEAPLSKSDQDFDDKLIEKLQKSIREIKVSREMGARYMALQDILDDERNLARQEGHQEGLKEGRQEGLREGLREGIQTVAKNLLNNGVSIEIIIKTTGLSEEEILNLKNIE